MSCSTSARGLTSRVAKAHVRQASCYLSVSRTRRIRNGVTGSPNHRLVHVRHGTSPLHRRWPNGRGHAQTGTGHRPAAFMPRRPPFAPSRPQPGPRPVRCHLGIPHGPIPALPVDALAFGIVDILWGRNATVGTVPPRKLGCGLNLAARGRIITRYLMGGLTDLTNQGAIKWGGRS